MYMGNLFRPALATLALMAGAGQAADIRKAPPLTADYVMPYPSELMDGTVPPGRSFSFANHRHIRIEGRIEPGDAAKLAPLITNNDPFQSVVVTLNSEGGDYQEGLLLADEISRWRSATFVVPGDTCLSACALAFLGGTREVIRRVLQAPDRYVHVDATVGFHAPFNTTYPTLPTVNDQTVQLVADLFYGQAREAIRQLQARIRPLELNTNFVFDMLGKGTGEFLYLDRYREVLQNQITVLADRAARPRQMSATAAKLACGFLIEAAVSPAEGFGDVIVPGNWTDIADPDVLANPGFFPTEVAVSDNGAGQATFMVETLLAGRGPFTCTISNAGDGVWRGDLSGNVPTVAGRMGTDTDITRAGAVPLNNHALLGPYLPWTAMGADDLLVTGSDALLFANVPEALRRADGPSFDCSGTLDPAAEIICRFPVLSRADATMVELYLTKRAENIRGLRDSQRAWISERNALCRPDWTNQADPFELTLTGYCLMESTMTRIGQLNQL